MQKTIFYICSEETGELVCEITFLTWNITSVILHELADFCADKYYVSSFHKYEED